MDTNQKRELFDDYRKSLLRSGFKTTRDDTLICPLCWAETPYDDLSFEHVVPASVGGRSKEVLTCRRCNNQHGSALDANLSNSQTVRDALHGEGTLKTIVNVNGKKMAADLKWGEQSQNFSVVPKASNLAEVSAIQEDFKADNVSKLSFTLPRTDKNGFQTALLRAAYLVLFKCFGYEYAKHEIVQVIRRRVCDHTLQHPRLASLIFEGQNCKMPYDEAHIVAPGNVNGVEFFLVIIRVRKARTSHFGVYMPVPSDRSEEFFDLMEQRASEHDGMTLTLPNEGIFT